jgi:predicted ATPase/class 3 adenylate cyclase
MTFEEILDQALAMLRRRGRVTNRALKLQFSLDDDHLEALKDEILYAHPAEHSSRIAVPGPGPRPSEAERRQHTVLFCDLVDSTTLASQLDPEEWREMVWAYHTGLVVVGEMGGGGRQERLALGDTPNLAARLQGLAASDTVVISAATHRLVRGLFTEEDLGLHTLKGVAVPVYQVLGESGVQSRREVAATVGLTPLVGRKQEVELLLERWGQVKEGLGQVVVLSGEAGIGKSRLVQVLKERLAGEPHLRWECRCSPYYQNSALYPVIDLFQRALLFERDDTPEAKLDKLEGALAQYHLSIPEVAPLFASLLSLPLPARYPPLTFTPQRQRQKTLEAVLAVLLALASQWPVLFIVEDLHWVDPSTLELLNLLIDQEPTARILTLLTCRPKFRPPWGFRAHLTSLTLNRLPHTQAEAMVERVVGKALPVEVRQQIAIKTDGVPLFVEELTKMVLESGLLGEQEGQYALTGSLPPLAIPATLHDSLMARLDRLAAVKAVAQLGAALGRTFPYELLRAVSPLDDATLQQALSRFVEAELLYQRGVSPQATYLFKHALIQEAAYQSLLKSTRQQYHQRIARVLEGRFPEIAATQPELLAHHCTEAGLIAEAISYWQRAGRHALERSANREAISHLTKGLELLKTLPDTPERAQRELDLQTALGPAWMAAKGYAAADVAHAYARARELCGQVGETPQLLPVLWGLWAFYLVRAEYKTARELGEQCLTLAQRLQDPALFLEAYLVLGMTLLWLGQVASARAYLERGIALYDPQQHRSHAFLYGQDPGVVCRAHSALALWWLGYPEQALQRSHEVLSLAQELAHPFSLGMALYCAACLHQLRREGPPAQERAEALIALSGEQGFSYWAATGTILRGWALAMQGQGEEGIAQIRQGLAAHRATGAEVGRPYRLAGLAEAYGKAGQVEEGLAVLAEALVTQQNTGEGYYEAELYRLKGTLLVRQAAGGDASRTTCPQGNTEISMLAEAEERALTEAEACFRRALEIARSQQAKSLELRAAMSLSQLWQRQGKRDEARQLLVPIYRWFTEGFDTTDLQEAKALLDELS